MDENLQIKIISPRQVLFNDSAKSLSSINSQGKFDILPEHANFITVIERQPIIVRKTNHEEVKFNFDLAIVYNCKNSIIIYTDIQLSLNPNNQSNH